MFSEKHLNQYTGMEKKSMLSLIAILLFFSSCRVGKQLAYFQDLNENTAKVQQVRVAAENPLRLQSDDQVQIVISSVSPEAAQLFNMMGSAIVSGTSSQMMQSIYTVSPSGNVTIPGIGDVHIAGLTTDQAKAVVREAVAPYLKDVVVSATLVNFRVTIMGEVMRPSTLQVAGEKINVLEALGMAGDLTVFAKRNNIKVIRKAGDKVEVAHLDLNNSEVMRSPYYNLRQNDVVYVEPIKRKGLQTEGLNVIIPIVTSFISLGIVALTRLK
ncbi:MAG: polysaccharide biosynthesis/export family protein [Agriterribacter sp.]